MFKCFLAENSTIGRAYIHEGSAEPSLAEIHQEMSELLDQEMSELLDKQIKRA